MYTGVYGVERHHIFSHTSKEIELSEDYGFIAPLRPDLHPNGTEEQFRQEFHYVSKG